MNQRTAPPDGTEARVMLCPQCNREVLAGRHCKLLCCACGYVESCEDNFVIDAEPRGGPPIARDSG